MIDLSPVRPYYMRPTLLPGQHPPVQPRLKFYPMSHLALPSGALACGFEDFDGVEPDGSKEAGFAIHACDDCEWEAGRAQSCGPSRAELDREDLDRQLEELPVHLTEEMAR